MSLTFEHGRESGLVSWREVRVQRSWRERRGFSLNKHARPVPQKDTRDQAPRRPQSRSKKKLQEDMRLSLHYLRYGFENTGAGAGKE
jgi:hypothetical protein